MDKNTESYQEMDTSGSVIVAKELAPEERLCVNELRDVGQGFDGMKHVTVMELNSELRLLVAMSTTPISPAMSFQFPYYLNLCCSLLPIRMPVYRSRMCKDVHKFVGTK